MLISQSHPRSHAIIPRNEISQTLMCTRSGAFALYCPVMPLNPRTTQNGNVSTADLHGQTACSIALPFLTALYSLFITFRSTAFHVLSASVRAFVSLVQPHTPPPQRGRLALELDATHVLSWQMFCRKSLTFQPPVRSIPWAFERRLPYGNQSPRLLAFISTLNKNGVALHHRRRPCSGLVTSRVPDEGRSQVSFVLRQRSSSTLSTLSTLSQQSSIDDIIANSTSTSMSASALLDTQAAAPAGSSHSPLWAPSTIPPNTTRTFAFLRSINDKYNLHLLNYEDLWKWSVEHPSEFWDAVWDETDVLGVKGQRGAVSSF